jgi:hypothetical protein
MIEHDQVPFAWLCGSMKFRHLAAAFLALIVLYLASVGPMWVLLLRWAIFGPGEEPGEGSGLIHAFNTFYAPIFWLAERYPVFGSALMWYAEFCGMPKL